MFRFATIALLAWAVLSAGCDRPQLESKEDSGDSPDAVAAGRPLQYPEGPTPPPQASHAITVTSVPAVVTEREASYAGEPRGDIRPMERPVPLSAKGGIPGDHETGIAAALLDWQQNEPLPGGLTSLHSTTADLAPRVWIEGGLLVFATETGESKRLPLVSLVSNAANPLAAYDAGSERFLIVALNEANGQSSLPITIAISRDEGPAGSWNRLSFGASDPEVPSPTALELVACDSQNLYLVTDSRRAASNDPERRSVWIVSKDFYRGESPTITRIGRQFPANHIW